MRPICIVCWSECDSNALYTSCQHFICVRCAMKVPQHQCPRCKKTCQVVRLGAPNFPSDVKNYIMGDPMKLLQQAVRVLEFQQRQDRECCGRVKELLSYLNTALQKTVAHHDVTKKELASCEAEKNNISYMLEEQKKKVHLLQERIEAHTSAQNTKYFPPKGIIARNSANISTPRKATMAYVANSTINPNAPLFPGVRHEMSNLGPPNSSLYDTSRNPSPNPAPSNLTRAGGMAWRTPLQDNLSHSRPSPSISAVRTLPSLLPNNLQHVPSSPMHNGPPPSRPTNQLFAS